VIFRQALLFLLLQFTDEDSNSSFIVQTAETVFYPCFEAQVTADKNIGRTNEEGRPKMTALRLGTSVPEESHSTHQYMAGMFPAENDGWKKPPPGRRQGHKGEAEGQMAHLLPPSCWHWWCLFYQIQILHITKGVMTSEMNPNAGNFFVWFFLVFCFVLFCFFSKNASAGFIFHRKSQDCQELAGSFIKAPKIALALHRKFRLLLKAEVNPTQVSLFSLYSRMDLPQNLTGLKLGNQVESSSSFFFLPEPQHTYPQYIKREEMPKPDVQPGKMSCW